MRNKKKGIGLLLVIFLSMDPGIALAEDWIDESSGIEEFVSETDSEDLGIESFVSSEEIHAEDEKQIVGVESGEIISGAIAGDSVDSGISLFSLDYYYTDSYGAQLDGNAKALYDLLVQNYGKRKILLRCP